MPEISFTDELVVELIESTFSDERVCHSAWTSTQGKEATPDVKVGLINSLMKNRHGTPFEHSSATFRVQAPIVVWREHHRHRIGWSYNEESGRYKELDPLFYLPGPSRPLVQVGKPMEYKTEVGTEEQYNIMKASHMRSCAKSYAEYRLMLDAGIMKEVARNVLPVTIMSTCITTCNPRSLMSFLSLRTRDEASMFPSKPAVEIELVARGYEMMFAEYMPITYEAFVKNGRVAP